jgi:hypothetical protein
MTNIQFDDYTKFHWYRKMLKGERGPISPNEIMAGYYRYRTVSRSTGEVKLSAVGVWYDPPTKEGIKIQVNGQHVEHEIGAVDKWTRNWPFLAKEVVEFSVYKRVLAGHPWPDQHVDPVSVDANKEEPPPLSTGPSAGESNSEVDYSPRAVMAREVGVAVLGVRRYIKKTEYGPPTYLIDSDDMAKGAQELRARLNAMANRAKAILDKANRSHLDAIAENRKNWSPIENTARDWAKELATGPLHAWEKHKIVQHEAALKASAAASAEAGHAVTVPSNAPAPTGTIKGATGRAASVKPVNKAVIVDYDLVYNHFKHAEALKAILQGLANDAIGAGIEVPGTTVEKDVKIS